MAGGGPRKESPARTEETTSDTSSTDGSGGLDQQVTLVVPKTARTSITSGPAPPARAPGAVRWREYANHSTGRRYYSDGTSTTWTPPRSSRLTRAVFRPGTGTAPGRRAPPGGGAGGVGPARGDKAGGGSDRARRRRRKWREYTDAGSGMKYYPTG